MEVHRDLQDHKVSQDLAMVPRVKLVAPGLADLLALVKLVLMEPLVLLDNKAIPDLQELMESKALLVLLGPEASLVKKVVPVP